MRGSVAILLGVLSLEAAPVAAQEAAAGATMACPASPVAPPAELAGWATRTALAGGADGASAPALAPGRGVDVALLPTPQVRYPLRPAHPGGSVSHGAVLRFTAAQPGRYRVAIGSAAWIDVVRDGAAIESGAHGPGPACTGIRKMVDFTLPAGDYLVQIAGNGSPTLPVLVARVP